MANENFIPYDIYHHGNPGQMSPLGTAARGPNSPFGKNEIVYIPGIGMRKFSDYGPGVKGADIPVTTTELMRSRAVNRMVNINGRDVQLTGYIPGNPSLDPTGGGKYEAYTGKPITPWSGQAPGGWEEPLANEPGFQTGPAGGPEEFEPTGGQPEATPQAAYEPQPGAAPGELPSPGMEQVANQYQEPYNFQPPAMPEPTAGGDYGGYPGPTPSELPSPSEIPMFQQQYAYPAEAPAEAPGPVGANVPTNDYGMMPTGPNEYLPSEGANIPTDESMIPTGPDVYADSTAGANIPTDESMIPTGPDTYQMPDQTYSYPDGTGGYTTLDASGNPVSDVASAPAQPVFDVNVNAQGPLYGSPGKTTTFGQDLSADLSDLGTALGTATPYNTALSGQPGFGQSPSSYQGPGAGAFWSPPGGSIGGTLGGSANAAFEQVPFWQRMLMRSAHAAARRGNRPLIGGGDAIARFAAQMGPPPPRHQGLYSPVARAQAIAAMAKAGGGTQQAPGGGMDVSPGQARGPGGRAMSPV